MNEKTAQQIARMKEATIGVEVEMNHITRDKAAKIAADFFGTGRFENTANRNGYCTWSAWDAQNREWKFQRDVSIAGPDSEKCELVTPILNYEDIESLQELIRRLRKAGAISHAGIGAGVHIHIGAKGHTAQSLRTLANIMASHERLIADALKIDQGRMNRYCRTVNPIFIEQLNKKKPTTIHSDINGYTVLFEHGTDSVSTYGANIGLVLNGGFHTMTHFCEQYPNFCCEDNNYALSYNQDDFNWDAPILTVVEKKLHLTSDSKIQFRYTSGATEDGLLYLINPPGGKIDIPITLYANSEIEYGRAVQLDFQWLQSQKFITVETDCGDIESGEYYLAWVGRSNNTHPVIQSVKVLEG